MLKNLLKGFHFSSPDERLNYLQERRYEKIHYRQSLTFVFIFSALFFVLNDVVFLLAGNLPKRTFAIRTVIIILALVLVTLSTNCTKLVCCRYQSAIREFLILLGITVLIVAIYAFTLESALTVEDPQKAVFFGINLGLEFFWIYLFIIYFHAEWVFRILFFVAMLLTVLIIGAKNAILEPGQYFLYIRVLILIALLTFLQEKTLREAFLKKFAANKSKESLAKILTQVHTNTIIRAFTGEIKYASVKELEEIIKTPFSDNLSTTRVEATEDILDAIKNVEAVAQSTGISFLDETPAEHLNKFESLSDFIKKLLTNPNFPLKRLASLSLSGSLYNSMKEEYRYLDINLSYASFEQADCIVILIRDITERINYLKQINQTQQNLLASISHELRTPLNGTLNTLERADEHESISEETKEQFIKPAMANARLLSLFINNVLDFIQIQQSTFRLFYSRGKLTEKLLSALELVRFSLKKKDLKLSMIYDNAKFDNLDFITDYNRLDQIFLNLVTNAIKYTTSGGIEIQIKEVSSSVVRISVTDSGIGMDEYELEKLEYKLNNQIFGSKVNAQSTGGALGLVISNLLAKKLNSHTHEGLKIQAKKDMGCVFSFDVCNLASDETAEIIPTIGDEGVKQEVKSHPLNDYPYGFLESLPNRRELTTFVDYQTSPRGLLSKPNSKWKLPMKLSTDDRIILMSEDPLVSDKRFELMVCQCPSVLVVDDDTFNLEAVENILKSLQITCDIAFNGKEALEKIHTTYDKSCGPGCHGYEMIFMDCNMPVMDGYEATKYIIHMIQSGVWRDIPILGCTAYEGRENLDKCLEVGMSGYIKKPVSVAKIKAALGSYIKVNTLQRLKSSIN